MREFGALSVETRSGVISLKRADPWENHRMRRLQFATVIG
jgi:hypothetical protein